MSYSFYFLSFRFSDLAEEQSFCIRCLLLPFNILKPGPNLCGSWRFPISFYSQFRFILLNEQEWVKYLSQDLTISNEYILSYGPRKNKETKNERRKDDFDDQRLFYDCDGPRDTAWQSLVTRSVTPAPGLGESRAPGAWARDNAVTTFCCHTLCVPHSPLLLPSDHDSVAKITDCSKHLTTVRGTGLSPTKEKICVTSE